MVNFTGSESHHTPKNKNGEIDPYPVQYTGENSSMPYTLSNKQTRDPGSVGEQEARIAEFDD